MRPPVSKGPHISQTEKSKAKEWKMVQTSCWSKWNQGWVRSKRRRTLRWVTMTPLGLPVEPEV